MKQTEEHCRCTLTNLNGVVSIGYGITLDKAIEDALQGMNLTTIPIKGPGIWELKENPNQRKK